MQELSFIIDIKKSGDSCKYFEGTKKYIATADIIDDEIVSYTEVTYTNKPSRANVIAKPGDVIFAKMQNTIKVIVVDEETSNYIYSTGFYCIQDDRYLPEFLKCYFMSKAFNEKKDKNCNGATMKALSDEGFKKIKLPLITKEVQKQIIDEYLAISSSIKNKNKQIAIFDELIKSQFIEMFENKGYASCQIIEVSEFVKDGTHQTPTYTEDKINGFKFLSSKDVMSKKIDWSNIKYIPADLHNQLYSTIKPRRNDILMSKNGVNYGVAALNDTDEIFDIYVSLALIRPKNIINPRYFQTVLNMECTKEQFDKSIKGIGVPNLHLSEIKKTMILLPPVELQDQFAAIVEQIDKSKYFGGLSYGIC